MISFAFAMDDKERGALEQVYINTNKELFKFAMSILKDHELAEDIIQEAFIRLSKNLNKIDSPDSNRTLGYMITIVKNLCFNEFRSHSKVKYFSLEDYDVDEEKQQKENIEEVVIFQEEYGLLKEAIASLDSKFREPLVLHYIQNMKEPEIAKILGITPQNVGIRIYRAKKKIREYIDRKEHK